MKKRWWIIPVIVVLLAAGVYGFFKLWGDDQEVYYRTATVERGDLVQTITATGTIQPLKVVDVGTQVTGRIKKLYVDFNSPVTEGQIVAEIAPESYKARTDQDKANLQQSIANVDQIQAKLVLAEQELKRNKELAERGLVTGTDLDTAVSNRDALEAQLKMAKAQIKQSKATLAVSKTDLAYTTIRSPVNGVVIARNVNEGQTVVASMSAQTIYQIATDLKKVQVEAAVAEADIGQIRAGEKVTFTVDAYPDEEFIGKVSQVRLSATITQNVVTYPVIIVADNPKEKLLPSMTADVSIEVARVDGALKLPNAALRFKPESAATEGGGGGGGSGGKKKSSAGSSKPTHEVWVQTPGGLRPVKVALGISDGTHTQVLEGGLKEGQEVVTGVSEQPTTKSEVVNPFVPKFPKKKGVR
jgi:HlyD family secretion protein